MRKNVKTKLKKYIDLDQIKITPTIFFILFTLLDRIG